MGHGITPPRDRGGWRPGAGVDRSSTTVSIDTNYQAHNGRSTDSFSHPPGEHIVGGGGGRGGDGKKSRGLGFKPRAMGEAALDGSAHSGYERAGQEHTPPRKGRVGGRDNSCCGEEFPPLPVQFLSPEGGGRGGGRGGGGTRRPTYKERGERSPPKIPHARGRTSKASRRSQIALGELLSTI